MTAEQAETYLRLRAEAELRRALTLPRYVPPDAAGMPARLRAAAGLARPGAALIASAARPVLPLARRAADSLQPLAVDASRALRPLGEDAVRALQPPADEAARALRPLAEDAVRALQTLGEQAVRLRPFAEETAHRLESIEWRAFGAAQRLGDTATGAIASVRRQAARTINSRPGVRLGTDDEHSELSAEEGVHRLRMVASALVQAGAIDNDTADVVLTGLQTALLARSRFDPRSLARQHMMTRRRQPTAGAPAGLYRAAGVGVTIPAAPGSGLGDTRLLTLVIAPDRASLTAVGRRLEPLGQVPRRDRWAALHNLHGSWPSAADDQGNSYELNLGSWSSESRGDWSGTLDISPVPPAGVRWLDLTMSPGSAPIRVDLTSADAGSDGATGPIPVGSPVDRLFELAAESLLVQAARSPSGVIRHHDLSHIADIATALEASGVLPSACAALDRLVALARRLGIDVPDVLRANARPAGLPDAWASVLENGHRRDGPHGVAGVAVVLPELDGTRFVLAGLRSDSATAELHVQGWGEQPDPYSFGCDIDSPLSWWAHDDAGRWHVATAGGGGYGDGHSDVRMNLFPPLHPQATSLEVSLASTAGRVTAKVPLEWLAPE